MHVVEPLSGWAALSPRFYKRTGGVVNAGLLDRMVFATVYFFPTGDPYNTARLVRFLSHKPSCSCLCSEGAKVKGNWCNPLPS